MKILFLCKRYYTNKDLLEDRFGRLYHLPVQLAALGHKVEVLALDYRHATALERCYESVPFLAVPAHPLVALALPARLLARARHLGPDVVVASGDSHIGFMGLLLARLLGARLAFDIYDYYPVFAGNRLPGMKQMFAAAARRADLLLCASPPLLDRMRLVNPACLLVENGVDEMRFHPGLQPAALAGDGQPLVGYFGSLTPSRGPLLVEACRRLRGRFPGLRLLLAGPNQGIDIPDEPWVRWLGMLPQADIPGLIAACDVVTVPYESTPFNDMAGACKLAEYLACARPVVATRIAGHEQVLGAAARGLCAPEAEALAAAIERQYQAPELVPLPPAWSWAAIARQLQERLSALAPSSRVAGGRT